MDDSQPLPKNWRRRAVGSGICLSPIAVLAVSVAVGIERGTVLTPGTSSCLPHCLGKTKGGKNKGTQLFSRKELRPEWH